MLKNKKISIVFLFVCIFLSSVFTTMSYADVITLDSTYTITNIVDYAPTKFNEVELNETDSNMVLSIIDYLKANNQYDTDTYYYYILRSYVDGTYKIVRYAKTHSDVPYYIKTQVNSSYGYRFYYSFVLGKDISSVTTDTEGKFISCSSFSSSTVNMSAYFGCYTYKYTDTPYTLFTGYDYSLSNSNSFMPLYTSRENWGITFFSSSTTTAQGTINTLNPKLTTNTPDEPTFPTNEEIAIAVQKFYDSDIYKNNNKFKDFLVIYYVHNQTFAFIGHTIGNNLEQVIVPPNVREQGKLYGEQWWHFKVNENAGAPPYGTTFYLYTTTDFGENFQYDGSDTIGDLVNVDFSKNAVIVYSNYDYTVETYVLDETTGDISYTEGVIAGNEYTYDENLNPTENYYNPLDNFIIVNPVEGMINDVDFNTINKVFEDSKTILNIENANWLFTANNQLINYFAGFITFIIILFAISRVLGG